MAGILNGDRNRFTLPNGKSLVGFAVGWMSSFGALIAVYARESLCGFPVTQQALAKLIALWSMRV